ncbi:MAG: carbonic anhydrase [Coriobacteriia bacterium]
MGREQILRELRDGNERYVRERGTELIGGVPGVVPAHRPVAVVIGCSDARVPVEQVFDQPPGSLFIVRVAGHVLEPAALASILYAARELEVRLVIVMGHQSCGAVCATLSGTTDEALLPLVAPIAARLASVRDEGLCEDSATRANARAAVTEVQAYLREVAPELAESVTVCGAYKSLDSGVVEWLE